MLTRHPPRRLAQGFSLVELMVGSVIGLIVVGAVIALVLSMMRSNRQTLQSTRLNQELRATLAVIASDLKRARGVTDPLTVATAAAGNVNRAITVTEVSAGPPRIDCISYSYEGAAGGDWRTIRINAAGRMELVVSATSPSPACNATGTELGSNQVTITEFDVQPNGTSNSNRPYTIRITGRLNDGDPDLAAISRTMTQSVFIRSVGDGT